MEIITRNIFLKWIWWQFFEVPKNILKAWKNFLKFGLNYFSTPLLIRTLFYPWRKYKWLYPRGFQLGDYFEALFSNAIFRILGALFRSVFIIIGIFFEILIFFIGLSIFLAWLILPLFLVFCIYHGFRLFFY
jgi:hypothetical protein